MFPFGTPTESETDVVLYGTVEYGFKGVAMMAKTCLLKLRWYLVRREMMRDGRVEDGTIERFFLRGGISVLDTGLGLDVDL